MPMISGRIASISGQENEIDGFHKSDDNGNDELNYYIEQTDTFYINDSTEVKAGLAVNEYFQEVEDVDVDNDEIEVGRTEVKKRNWTRWWVAKDNFVVAQNKDGEFAFDLIEQATGGEVDKVEFDLPEIVRDYPGQWMGGIEDRQGNVENATFFGEDIEHDGDLGTAFQNSDKSQIGPRIPYDGEELKIRIGPSWYQVVKPANFPRQKYLAFLDEVLLEYDES